MGSMCGVSKADDNEDVHRVRGRTHEAVRETPSNTNVFIIKL